MHVLFMSSNGTYNIIANIVELQNDKIIKIIKIIKI